VANLLVTGGAGFIGANFIHHWMARHPEDRIVVLDALTYAGNLASLGPALADPRLHFVHADIRSTELVAAVLRDYRISRLVHFAAESHVDRSIASPDPFLGTNVLGTHALLKAAREVWLEEGRGGDQVHFHHISTDEVYGSLGPDAPPFTEEDAYRPSSPYAASKAASDHLVRAYFRTYGLPVTITNCSNNYGPYQFPEKLIPLMLVHALEGRPLPVYGDGLNVRDWLHVADHCEALERVLARGRQGETYNIGGNNEWTNLAVIRLLGDLLDEAFAVDHGLVRRFPACPASRGIPTVSLVTHVPDRPGHDRRYAVNSRKAFAELGFRPIHSLELGLRETVAWYLEHEQWWRAVIDGSYRRLKPEVSSGNVSN
jgi:dTDP-glucose 4,6-dehydratase